MDQSMKIKDRHRQGRLSDQVRRLRHQHGLSGIVANTDYVKANADLVKRFMSATTKAVEAAEKDAKGAAQAILDANPKGGKIDTLTQGFELTIPLYRRRKPRASGRSRSPTRT
jgi:ABC-type nitrate/sulfonate/bicarbonate transport systems, periplasmic components